MTVSSRDTEWTTNIKKAVANAFRNAALRSSMGGSDEGASHIKNMKGDQTAFQTYERSIQGHCLTQ